MRRGNLHCHSTFSDGKNSPEEMTLAAIKKGFAYLGFSEHSTTEYEASIKQESIHEYFAEVKRLQSVYSGQIELYAGFENDYYGLHPKPEQDFTIASVHDILDEATGKYHTVDYTHDKYKEAIDAIGGGDVRKLIAKYYDMVAELAESYRPDIVGHLDLITKFNEDGRYFDERSSWYRDTVTKACERIAATGCIVELNTGAIARGYRSEPYPARWILELLRALQVPVTISSDAHNADGLDFWFDQSEALLRDCGYKSIRQLSGGKWIDVEL
jgi:histidinol-phosphatase (PHP family)